MKMTAIAAALLGLAFSATVQAEPAGKVLVVAGDATLSRAGRLLPLRTGVTVESGDVLEVGDKSTLQVRFTDESVVALRANSQFRIEDYKFDKSADSDRSILGLLKGGMRTITGLIGKANQKNYSVRTATATIGIRGTHFSVVSCNNDCRNPDGSQGLNGTFGAVTDGRVTVTNETGQKEFAQQDFFHVPAANVAPVQLLAPPPILNDRGLAARGRSPKGDASVAATGTAARAIAENHANAQTSTSPQLTEQRPPSTQLIAPLTRVSSNDQPNIIIGGGGGGGMITVVETRLGWGPMDVEANAKNYSILELRSAVSEVSGALFNNAATLAAALRTVRPVGSSAAAGAYWMYEPPHPGSPLNHRLGSHHAWGDSPQIQLPGAGTAQYNFVGGTAPTDNFGRVGAFVGGNLTMNFTSRTISNTQMQLIFSTQGPVGATTYHINASSWAMGGGPHNLSGTTCFSGCVSPTSAGAINGRFVGATLQGYTASITVKNPQLSTGQQNSAGLVAAFAKQ